MDWFFFTVLASILFAVSRIISKLLLKKKSDPIAYTICHNFITGLTIVPFYFLDFKISFQLNMLPVFLLTMIFYGLGDVFTYKGLKKIDVSVWRILAQTRIIWVFLGGLILYNESASLLKFLGVLLVLLGSTMALIRNAGIKISKGVIFTLLSQFFLSLGFLSDKTILNSFSVPVYTSLVFLFPLILIFLYIKADAKKVIDEYKNQGWRIVLAGVFFGFQGLCLRYAFKLGEVSRVMPVAQLSTVILVMTGILFLKEREGILNKIMGMTMAIIGVLILKMY